MGWWERTRARLFGRARPDPVQFLRWIPYVEDSGIRLTPDEALSLSAVWACIDAIAKAIASCPWQVFLPKGGGRRELLENDPVVWVLNTRPNPEMTAIAFWEAMLYVAIPFGNAYAEIVRDRAGRIAEIWPLEHDRVTPRRDAAGVLYYEFLQWDGTPARLEQRQVFHLRGPSLTGFLGENLISRAAKAISAAVAAERYATQFFGNSAQPAGVLEIPGKLSPEAHASLRADIDLKRKEKHSTIILEQGAKFTATATDPQKTQMVETRQFDVEEICRWFGVPPHKVQHLLRSTFNNIEHQSIEFVRDALRPWCVRLQQEADYKLFRQDRGPWRHTEIDTDPLSQGDELSRAQAAAIWRQNGIKTANEIRRRERLNDAGADGDVLLVQSNLTTVQNLVNPPKPPATAVPALPAGEVPDSDADEMDPSVEASAESVSADQRRIQA